MDFLDFSGLSQNRGPSDFTKEGMLQSQIICITLLDGGRDTLIAESPLPPKKGEGWGYGRSPSRI